MKKTSKKYKSGFSIVELIIIIVAFVILAAVGIVGYNIFVKKNSSSTSLSGEWITIGSQTWSKANLNIGTMVTSDTDQTDNSVIEKYCYDDIESNCATYGALYQRKEAMQYVPTEGAQGICPVGSHIPSDNDWKILEIQLGMTQDQADAKKWRGSEQGTQMKVGGNSGMDIPLAGFRKSSGSYSDLSSTASLWSSSVSSGFAWYRRFNSDGADVYRYTNVDWDYGFSVRCVKN